MPVHLHNWYVGWVLVLVGFATGAGIGLFFHQPKFLGGYDSFRRRLVRLGHIALVALGLLNVVYGQSPWPEGTSWRGEAASWCFMAGGVSMPAICFLTAWRVPFRFLFAIPVATLILGVVFTVRGGP